jgi:uncharacterized membrane protein YdjX (TVP38/TMEM64 family)
MFWEKLQKIILILFLFLVLGSLIAYHSLGDEINLLGLREYLNSFGVWTPLVFIFLYIIGTIFIPSTPFMATAGILFGFQYGLIYSLIGGLLSATITFFIARILGKEKVEHLLKHRYLKFLNQYNGRLSKKAVLDIAIMRITPILPFNILNIILGVSNTKTKDYLWGSLLGLIPSHLLTVYFGIILTKIF